jgi:hypothetical protein
VVIGSVTSGCEPLRKKFTRKKQAQKEDAFIPVLEPEDYPEPTYTSQDLYQQHYSLWRVWYKDLVTALAENDSDKRQRYTLLETVSQLQKMSELIKGEKKAGLEKVIAELKEIGEELGLPKQMRNMSAIRLSVRNIEKEVRNEYQLEGVKDSF